VGFEPFDKVGPVLLLLPIFYSFEFIFYLDLDAKQYSANI